MADLLPVEYYHVVFTLPAPISALAYTNKAVIYRLLFEVAAETLLTIAADPKHLGATIGATLVLHTWGSAMTHHPHVHGIVPGGGLSPDGERWVACRRGFFLPVRVLSRLFRRRFLEELAKAHRAGQLRFFGEFGRWRQRPRLPAGWRRCARANGSSMPSAPSPAPRRCSPTCRAIPIGWRSRTRRLVSHGRRQRVLPLEGLPRQGAHPPQDDDAHCRGVHAALPAARAAVRLPSHPPLRKLNHFLNTGHSQCRSNFIVCPSPRL
jgi:hypothetical protein